MKTDIDDHKRTWPPPGGTTSLAMRERNGSPETPVVMCRAHFRLNGGDGR
ncbi:hypothetical protein [Desulfonatronum thioautotrophicum]|nr:hypothetical protein [Desulfonatronum thioautotrophicum]